MAANIDVRLCHARCTSNCECVNCLSCQITPTFIHIAGLFPRKEHDGSSLLPLLPPPLLLLLLLLPSSRKKGHINQVPDCTAAGGLNRLGIVMLLFSSSLPLPPMRTTNRTASCAASLRSRWWLLTNKKPGWCGGAASRPNTTVLPVEFAVLACRSGGRDRTCQRSVVPSNGAPAVRLGVRSGAVEAEARTISLLKS